MGQEASTLHSTIGPASNQSSLNSSPNLFEISDPDFILIWNESESKAVTDVAFRRRSVFEYNLEEEGLVLQWENNEIVSHLHIVKIWSTLEVLKRYSEILRLRLPMKQVIPNGAREARLSKPSTYIVSKCSLYFKKLFHLSRELFPTKSRKLTGVYNRDKEYLFDVDESNMHEIFPLSVRARIVRYILRRKPYKAGEELERDAFAVGYDRLIQQGVYEAGYPLHDGLINSKGTTRNLLYEHWGKLTKCLRYQPLDMIKDYFGENFALYFAWLGYYTSMLVYAASFGVVSFLFGLATFSKDQFVNDVCNQNLNFTMCPLCDNSCPYWKLSEKCKYSRFTHLFDNDFTIIFAFAMSVWMQFLSFCLFLKYLAAFFLEYWKRYSAKMTHQWDLTGFDLRDSNPRPEYVSALKRIFPKVKDPNKDDEEGKGRKFDNVELSVPFWRKKLPFSIVSYSAVLLLIVLAFVALFGVIVYRLWMTLFLSELNTDKQDISWRTLIVSISAASINLSFIMMFGKIYKRIAIGLTEMEFPRTQSEFEASYTLKIYLLQFVNNYSSIFYVAFFKGAFGGAPHNHHRLFGRLRQEECGLSCMPELCIQLAVIMIGKQAKSMLMESFIPFMQRVIRRASQRMKKTTKTKDLQPTIKSSSPNKAVIQWVADYDLLEWQEYGLTDEYLEMVLQFGFVTIFVSAFPLAPLFALINNIFEVRVDASKLLRHYRRPVGIRVRDIGVWSDIIDGVIKLAVISNACIIALTSNIVPKFMYRYFLLEESNPNYGTLNGYLRSSLTLFNTSDIEKKPLGRALLASTKPDDVLECFYPTLRYDSSTVDPTKKYGFREEHWKVWLARVVFVLLYENFVGIIITLLRWIIPDVPSRLRTQIQREERMVNQLILEHELQRAQKIIPVRHSVNTTDINMQQHMYNANHSNHEHKDEQNN